MANFLDVLNGQVSPELISALEAEINYLDSVSDNAPATTIVFRPGATGDDAAAPNVFTDWQACYDALIVTQKSGIRHLEFDNRWAPAAPSGFTGNGLNPCYIPPGTWDMSNVVWTDRKVGPSGTGKAVEVAEGASFPNFYMINAGVLYIIYNGETGAKPFQFGGAGNGPGLFVKASSGGFITTNASAQAAIAFNAFSFMDFHVGETYIIGGYDGDAMTASLAPIVDTQGNFVYLFGRGGNWRDNTLRDTGGGGTVLCFRSSSFFDCRNDDASNWVNPTFDSDGGTYLYVELTMSQRWRVGGRDNSDDAIAATITHSTGGKALHGWITPCDSTAAAASSFIVELPAADTVFRQGCLVTVQDVGGQAAVAGKGITIRALSGDSINGVAEAGGGESDQTIVTAYGSMQLWCDGAGGWYVKH